MAVLHAGAGPPATMTELIRRKLPGHSLKDSNGDVVFIRGRVIHSGWGKLGSANQFCETDSKLVGIVALCGHNYIYWCPTCRAQGARGPGMTIFEQEMLITKQVRSSDVNRQRCVFCEGPILPVKPGTKVRLHYRFSATGTFGGWWAEVWEW